MEAGKFLMKRNAKHSLMNWLEVLKPEPVSINFPFVDETCRWNGAQC